MSGNKLLVSLKKNWFFVLTYLLIAIFFLKEPMVTAWDDAEYLAHGKYMFTGLGYSSWYRPIIWPLVLGSIWLTGISMPFGMKLATALIYLLIPLITYFKFQDSRKYAGLIIITHPIFFQFSHMPLSHVLATLFIVMSYSTRGVTSGAFAALAGLTRFTYFIYMPFSLFYGNWKKRLKGQLLILVPYFLWALVNFKDPLFQFVAASGIINQPEFLWFWEKGIFFYLTLLALSAPFVFFAIVNKKPTTLAFFASAIYFLQLTHKEERFLIDFFIYAALSLSETKWGVRQIIYAITISAFIASPYSFPNMFENVEDGATVFGMEPSINAYKDVIFLQWFGPYESFRWDADYCIFSAGGVPCREGYCEGSIKEFYDTCTSWTPIAESEGYYVGKNPTLG
ncbi:MAG: hypothetical protein GOU98_00805 [Candidatus Altiarchaeota archaeon]|nr:hypothetical protein [Candidatus Altiarchaeota archaeon]